MTGVEVYVAFGGPTSCYLFIIMFGKKISWLRSYLFVKICFLVFLVWRGVSAVCENKKKDGFSRKKRWEKVLYWGVPSRWVNNVEKAFLIENQDWDTSLLKIEYILINYLKWLIIKWDFFLVLHMINIIIDLLFYKSVRESH